MNPFPPELWMAAAGLSFVLIVGFTLFARWCGNSPAVSNSKLEALRVGMSPDEVIALLGQPRQKHAEDKGEELWYYGAQWKRHLLIVEFNEAKTVREYVHGVPRQARSKKNPPA